MSSEHKENLTKLSMEALEELYERQNNILKNRKIIDKLPDKGKQLKEKLDQVKKELELRQDIKELEQNMNMLTINNESTDVLKEKHVQYICSIEKSPKKERYKPFSTLVKEKEHREKTTKPTQLIPLAESITLLAEQANKLPVDQIKLKIEGGEIENNEEKDEVDDSEQ